MLHTHAERKYSDAIYRKKYGFWPLADSTTLRSRLPSFLVLPGFPLRWHHRKLRAYMRAILISTEKRWDGFAVERIKKEMR